MAPSTERTDGPELGWHDSPPDPRALIAPERAVPGAPGDRSDKDRHTREQVRSQPGVPPQHLPLKPAGLPKPWYASVPVVAGLVVALLLAGGAALALRPKGDTADSAAGASTSSLGTGAPGAPGGPGAPAAPATSTGVLKGYVTASQCTLGTGTFLCGKLRVVTVIQCPDRRCTLYAGMGLSTENSPGSVPFTFSLDESITRSVSIPEQSSGGCPKSTTMQLAGGPAGAGYSITASHSFNSFNGDGTCELNSGLGRFRVDVLPYYEGMDIRRISWPA